ncbi:TIGR04222 domain-containing membrane protein [Plantactinospora solaniradicis]|uniref:TIGR04222 domain-containing membrane protein n=1 Tax=Plantactinospora solaniradicis TaxID=1723736 RepID=A0ABW1KIZ4_9ACTN
MKEVLPSEGDTWGIPGPTFLTIFLVAAGLIVLTTVLHRLVRFAGRRPPEGFDRLHPIRAAYLHGGGRLAVYTALGMLRAAGAVGVAPDRTLVLTGPLPALATPLDQAVYHAASRRGSARTLPVDDGVSYALHELRTELSRDGLALRWTTRLGAAVVPVLAGLALVAVGGVRMIAGAGNGKPVQNLFLACTVFMIVMIILASTVPKRTRAAKRALRSLRRTYRHLGPGHAPAYATYGAAGVAMGIAIFGPASLWALDPEFAAGAGIERTLGTGFSTGSGFDSNANTHNYASSCGGGDSGSGGGGDSGGGGGGCGG